MPALLSFLELWMHPWTSHKLIYFTQLIGIYPFPLFCNSTLTSYSYHSKTSKT